MRDRQPTTIRDIARAADVSVSTASLALNGDSRVRPATRQRVLDAAAQLDFHPSHTARSLSSGRTWSLHLLNPFGGGASSSTFFTRFVRGVHQVVHGHDYTLALTVLDDEAAADREVEKLIRERRTDGVILMNLSDDECLLERLLRSGLPHVLLGHSTREGVASVDNDNEAVAADATRHLLARGRRSILFLNAPEHHAFAQERARGHLLAHAGRPAPDGALLRFGLQSTQSARAEVERCLAEGLEFDGVLASSDELALGALRALRDAGKRVPHDVAVVGMNNDELTEYTEPRLTSVELNAVLLGEEAGRLLLRGIAGDPPERRLVPHALVERESG